MWWNTYQFVDDLVRGGSGRNERSQHHKSCLLEIWVVAMHSLLDLSIYLLGDRIWLVTPLHTLWDLPDAFFDDFGSGDPDMLPVVLEGLEYSSVELLGPEKLVESNYRLLATELA